MASANPIEEKSPFADDVFRNYFRINLKYNADKEKWIRKTILHFSLTVDRKNTEGSLLMKHLQKELEKNVINVSFTPASFCLQGKLINESIERHAEKMLLEPLESSFLCFNTARKEEKDKEEKTIKHEPQDLSDTMSKMSMKDTEKPMDENMALILNLLMNYSPCSECAKLIIAFKKTVTTICDIRISIRFGTFYRLYSENNEKGLVDLIRNKISLDLIWDYPPLQSQIQQIGNEEERMKRKQNDQEIMEKIHAAAKE